VAIDGAVSVPGSLAIAAATIDVTGTITASLELQRAYEANQRMIQSADELMMRAANDIARPTT